MALLAIGLVALSLRRPEVPEFAPTPVGAAAPAGPDGARILTVDASDPERWTHVDLVAGRVVADPAPLGWDLAFRRFEVRVNGGAGQAGGGGALDLGPVPIDAVGALPGSGYEGMVARGRDTTHAALDDWYTYSFTSHLLQPRDRTYALRTAGGRHALVRFLGYYCPGARPGCVTLRIALREEPPAPAAAGAGAALLEGP